MTTLKNGLSVRQNLIGFLFLAGLLILAIAWVTSPQVNAKTETLQEAVEMSQADYDVSLTQAQNAVRQHCENWRALALAKHDLANAMKISTNINKEAVSAVDCSASVSLVPISFI